MKKILITGGAGFIGFHLATYLNKEGYHIDLVDNFKRGHNDTELKKLAVQPNCNIIKVDLLDGNFRDILAEDYDIIFHFAALLGVANVLKAPYKVLCDNVSMAINALKFASSQKKLQRFIYASTSEVYAGTLKYFDMQIPTPETTPLTLTDMQNPRTSYMLSKLYGEALCQQAGIPFTIIRPHNIYGPRMGLSHVIPELLKKVHEAENGGELEIFSPDHTRTFCFVNDAIKLIFLASENPKCENEILNIGIQKPEIAIRDLANIVINAVGKKLILKELPPTSGSPSRRCPDMTKTSKCLGYESHVSLEGGIKITYEWYRYNVFKIKQ